MICYLTLSAVITVLAFQDVVKQTHLCNYPQINSLLSLLRILIVLDRFYCITVSVLVFTARRKMYYKDILECIFYSVRNDWTSPTGLATLM